MKRLVIKIFLTEAMENIFQAKIQCHVLSKSYYLWVQFEASDKEDTINYWYYQSKSGARSVGSCAHVSAVLWFIGIQRHADKVLQNQIMPDNFLDCCAKDTDYDVSSSDNTDINLQFIKPHIC